MEEEFGPTRNRRGHFLLRALGAAAAVAGIIGLAFQVMEWQSDSRPTPPPTTTAAAVAPGAAATPGKRAAGDEQVIQPGQCVRNTADEESPVYKVAACGTGTLRVLARIEQAIDDEDQADALCTEKAPTFTEYHYSNWAKRSDYLDIVFCLGPA